MGAVALMLGAPAAALAGSPSAQPQPQKAAPVTAAAPSPDPTPQASTLSSTPHTTVTSHPSTGVPVAVAPTVTPAPRSTEPSQPVASSPVRTTATLPAARPAATAATDPPARSAPAASAVHRAPARHRTDRSASPVHRAALASTPFVLTLLDPRQLPRLPLEAVAVTKGVRPDGTLLLLSALALGTLVVASLALLRRLTRLHDDWPGRSA
jgi:hypothetical protein